MKKREVESNRVNNRRREVSSLTVRPDYAKHPHLTLAEAGKVAGVKPQTVALWLRKRLVKRGRQVGAYVVDHESLTKFLKEGGR